MYRKLWFVATICVVVEGLAIFENQAIKKIFQQDPSFCFKPFNATGCNGTVWNAFSSDIPSMNSSNHEQLTLAFLFTPKNPKYPEFLHLCDGKLPYNTNYNPKFKTEIIIHGYLDGACRSAWMREMKDELFKRGSYNVIFIDWTWGNGPKYDESAANTKVVGKQLAILLQNIMNQSGAGPEKFHLIGHSFGAHIAGFAGKIVKNIRRITALDPAMAPFQNKSKDERLDSTDANLVDVIHTNAGTEVGEAIGDINPLGHADFYPNGGKKQDSCRLQILKSYLALDFLYATISLVPRVCSHMQAVQYYKASINPKKCEIIGVQCPDYESFASGKCTSCFRNGSNCAVMGMNHEYYTNRRNFTGITTTPRKFYLNTTLTYPYCDNSALTFV